MGETALQKMDPMVRKLDDALTQFKEALHTEDLVSAQLHLRTIKSTSDYLSEDVISIQKNDSNSGLIGGVNEQFAGGVPVWTYNETEQVINVGDRDRILKGTIFPARTGSIMKPHRSPGHRTL